MIKSELVKKTNSEECELKVTIDNGDLKLIDSLVESYSFKERDGLIKFAIAALLEGNNNEGLFTIKSIGEETKKVLSRIAPPEDLLKGE